MGSRPGNRLGRFNFPCTYKSAEPEQTGSRVKSFLSQRKSSFLFQLTRRENLDFSFLATVAAPARGGWSWVRLLPIRSQNCSPVGVREKALPARNCVSISCSCCSCATDFVTSSDMVCSPSQKKLSKLDQRRRSARHSAWRIATAKHNRSKHIKTNFTGIAVFWHFTCNLPWWPGLF